MKTAHETRDVDVISVFLIVVALFIGGVLLFSGVWVFMHYLRAKAGAREAFAPPSGYTSAAFPEPHLEDRPGLTIAAVRANEDAQLNSYGWVDRKSGTAHIPIDRAMQLLIDRGLPNVGAGQTPLQLMQGPPPELAP